MSRLTKHMNQRLSRAMILIATSGLLFAACGEAPVVNWNAGANGDNGDWAKGDSSIDAIFLNFRFSGKMIAGSPWGPEKQIESQLLYTIGQLNGDNSVGRIDKVVLSNIEVNEVTDGYAISYDAEMPVAWGQRENVPTNYTLILPQNLSYRGQAQFTQKYSHTCVDPYAHDVDSGSMWYYYRPGRAGCELEPTAVHYFNTEVTVSPINTTGKYPEYHKVWEDNRLEVVAIFGKFKKGATNPYDAGISSYNSFVQSMTEEFRHDNVQTTPANLMLPVGVETPEVTFEATLQDGRKVRVVVMLVDGVQEGGTNFDRRYEKLSKRADLIAYNGHSGLGANIRALAQKGRWVAGQYAMVFMNGCDTYAYVDSELADAHAAVNSDDPNGTKYVDIITNAMPAPASYSSRNTLVLTQGLLAYDNPMTYEQMFEQFNRSQVVLVSGEEDNTFTPNGTF